MMAKKQKRHPKNAFFAGTSSFLENWMEGRVVMLTPLGPEFLQSEVCSNAVSKYKKWPRTDISAGDQSR